MVYASLSLSLCTDNAELDRSKHGCWYSIITWKIYSIIMGYYKNYAAAKQTRWSTSSSVTKFGHNSCLSQRITSLRRKCAGSEVGCWNHIAGNISLWLKTQSNWSVSVNACINPLLPNTVLKHSLNSQQQTMRTIIQPEQASVSKLISTPSACLPVSKWGNFRQMLIIAATGGVWWNWAGFRSNIYSTPHPPHPGKKRKRKPPRP